MRNYALFAWVTAILALLVAIAQALLFRQQLKRMANDAETAKAAAQASLTQAEAIRLAERAYVKMSHEHPGIEIANLEAGVYHIRMTVKNFGRTPARVTSAALRSELLPYGTVPKGAGDDILIPGDRVVQSFLVTGDHVSFTYLRSWGGGKGVAVQGRSEVLWLCGFVDYIDVFGERHRAGYGRFYNPELDDPVNYRGATDYEERSNLEVEAGEAFNYDRVRKSGEGIDW